MTTIIYGRVSTDHQDNSIQLQEEKGRNYAAMVAQGDELTVITDPDTSGGIPIWEREGGKQLVRSIEAGGVRNLIVARLDRLGRSARDFHNFIHYLDKHGVILHIVDLGGSTWTTAGIGKLLLGVLALVAEFERDLIRSRTQEIADRNFRMGRSIGTEPYGFDKQPDKTVTPNEREQAVLRTMVQWRESGMGFAAIATRLNREGVPTKRGAGLPVKRKGVIVGTTSGLWNYETVKTVLTSRHTLRCAEPDGR